MRKVKALVLLSGGLDSILAAKLILGQGIAVEAITFTSPFFLSKDNASSVVKAAKNIGVELKIIKVGKDYLSMVKKPKHGYGRNLNPCIDCKIFMLKKAKKYARTIEADFVVTGEVLGERPMSQHAQALRVIEEESGLKGRLLRPLSAKLLPETEVEKKGLVDRNKLLSIQGRSRRPQIKLVEELGITSYSAPAGGCLLTCKEYAQKLKDLFTHAKRNSIAEVAVLKIGRHFRFGRNKIIVGKNQMENNILAENKTKYDYFFEVADVGSPLTLLRGSKTKKAIRKAAELTAFYSDAKNSSVIVKFGKEKLDKSILVSTPSREEVECLRIG